MPSQEKKGNYKKKKKLCNGAFWSITLYFEFHKFTALQTILRIPQTSRFTILIVWVIATDYILTRFMQLVMCIGTATSFSIEDS